MLEFFAALVFFLVTHAIPARQPMREWLIDALGRRTYLAVYSAVSLALLAWLISAAMRAPDIAIWQAPQWLAGLTLIAVPLAVVLIVAGLVAANPLSVSFRSDGYDPTRPGVLAISRHPVLWGFGIWGGAHIAVTGDAVGVVLFGALTIFSLLGTVILDRRKARLMGEAEWRRLAANTGNLPLAAIVKGNARPGIDPPLVAGTAAAVILSAALLAGGHLWLFGADPLAMLR